MKEITYYIADDGTKFKNEHECLEYEIQAKAKNYNSTLELYDKHGKKFDISTMTEADFYGADIIVVKSEDAYDYLAEIEDYFCVTMPDFDNFVEENFNCSFYYDYDDDEWRSCKKTILECEQIIKKLSKYVVDKE